MSAARQPETPGKDRGAGHHHRGKSSERFLNKEAILGELAIVPGQTILDAGCGNGYMSKEFSRLLQNRGKVYALDPDEEAIAVLREQTRDTNIVPLVGDITATTDIPANSLDLVYLATVFHGFARREIDGFNTEVRRVLKPGGILAIVEINKEPTPFGPPLDIRFSPAELQQAVPLVPLRTVAAGEYFYLQLFEKQE